MYYELQPWILKDDGSGYYCYPGESVQTQSVDEMNRLAADFVAGEYDKVTIREVSREFEIK